MKTLSQNYDHLIQLEVDFVVKNTMHITPEIVKLSLCFIK
jgi:hypothetical protein